MSDLIITARQLSKQIKAKSILQDISVTAEAGNIIGILGKNGAGKTTLFEVLLGFSPASSGHSRIFNHDSMQLPQALKSRIGFVPQQDELITMLTGEQQLSLVASFYKHWDHELITKLALDWEVPLKSRINKLSGGERQKLSTLLALGHRPELLILDEPVASLDPIARRKFIQQILEIAESPTRTVLFSSHIVSDVERVANQIWMLRSGKLDWIGDLDALKESVVRLHIRSSKTLSAPLPITNKLSSQIDGQYATVSVSQWQACTRQALAVQLDAEIEVEPLGLEDIFLEMNK